MSHHFLIAIKYAAPGGNPVPEGPKIRRYETFKHEMGSQSRYYQTQEDRLYIMDQDTKNPIPLQFKMEKFFPQCGDL